MTQWYSEGTLSLENGSIEVVGAGTNFAGGGVQDGYGLIIHDETVGYQLVGVDTVKTGTALTLQEPWTGATATGVEYRAFPTAKVSVQYLTEAKTLLASFGHLRETADLIQEFVTDRNAETLAASLRAVEAEQNALTYANQASANATKTGQDKAAVTTIAGTVRTDRDTVVERTGVAIASSDQSAKNAADSLTYRNQTQASAQAAANSASGSETSNVNSKKSADASALSAQKSEASNVQAGERLTSIQAIQTNVQGLRDATGTDRATVEGILATVTSKQADVTTKAGQVAADRTVVSTNKDATLAAKLAAEEAARQAADSAGSIDTSGFARLNGANFTGPLTVSGAPVYHSGNLDTGRLVQGDNANRTTSIDEADLNTARPSGFYNGTSLKNAPITDTRYWHLLNQRHHNTANHYASQLLISHGSIGDTFVRTIDGETKTPWTKMWNAANFDPNSKANLTGATFTGAVSVPSSLTVRAENSDLEGGQIILKKAPNQGLNGDMVIDTQGNHLRIYDNVSTGRMIAWDAVTGGFSVNGQTVLHTGNLAQNYWNGLLTVQGGGLAGGYRAYNVTAKRDWRLLARDDGTFTISDETAGASRLQLFADGSALIGRTTATGAVSVASGNGNQIDVSTDGGIELTQSAGRPYIDFKNTATKDYDYRVEVDIANSTLNLTNHLWAGGNISCGGSIYGNNSNLYLTRIAPTLYFLDTDHRSAMIHVNTNTFHILRGSGVNSTTWEQYNGAWPLTINLENNDANFGGSVSSKGNMFAAGSQVFTAATLTNLNQLANGPGYITKNDSAYPRRYDQDVAMRFYWSGQGGQPNWLWGGSDGTNMYVYNPSNFSVNNAANLAGIGGGNQAGYIRRANDAATNGAWSRQLVLAGDNNSNDIWSPPLEIREVGLVGNADSGTSRAPGIVFHHSSVAASAMKMYNDGSFRFIRQSSTGGSYQNVWAQEHYATGWFRPTGDTGVYWDGRGRGIAVADVNSSYGNITTHGTGAGGWQGYSINNWLTMMANGSGTNTTRGFYSAENGGWLLSWDSANNAVFPGNVTAYSDERLKDNKRPIDNVAGRRAGMARAAMLYERGGQTRVGFGAQTLEPHVPEVVITSDDLVATKSVNYADMVAILAVDNDQQAKKIETLEARLAALEALITSTKGQ